VRCWAFSQVERHALVICGAIADDIGSQLRRLHGDVNPQLRRMQNHAADNPSAKRERS
jgi:hypothetical protein